MRMDSDAGASPASNPFVSTAGYIADHFLHTPGCHESYFDKPRRAETATVVLRKAHLDRPYAGVCSTDFIDVDIPLARVTMIDGPYRPAGAASRGVLQ